MFASIITAIFAFIGILFVLLILFIFGFDVGLYYSTEVIRDAANNAGLDLSILKDHLSERSIIKVIKKELGI